MDPPRGLRTGRRRRRPSPLVALLRRRAVDGHGGLVAILDSVDDASERELKQEAKGVGKGRT